jgi:hypothetical protein
LYRVKGKRMGVIEGLRNGLRTRERRMGALGAASISLALLFLTIQFRPAHKYARDVAFFTDDDGETWYKDSVDDIPPYDHNGKTAVRAVIYSWAGGSKQFCGFLEQFPPKAKAAIEAAAASAQNHTPPQTAGNIAYGEGFSPSIEVKKPKSNDPWVLMNSKAATPVLSIQAPDGSEFDSVLP